MSNRMVIQAVLTVALTFGVANAHSADEPYKIGMLLAEGIKRAGPNVTGATLKTALEGIKDFHGVVGTFDFSPTRHAGTAASGQVIAQIKNGQVVLVK